MHWGTIWGMHLLGMPGEAVLNEICPEGFKHYIQSVRVVEVLEKNGQGLNLTKEVRDGMMNHSTSRMPKTLEGKIVRLSDKIAYINHDIDDAIRGRIITEEELPDRYTDVLGHDSKERLNTLIHDVIDNSMESAGYFDVIACGRGEAWHAPIYVRPCVHESES